MVAASIQRLSPRVTEAFTAVVVRTGKLIGFARRRVPLVPGLSGAVLVSLGAGEVVGHIFGHGLAPWTAAVVGGLFLLQMDRQISVRSHE